MVGPIIFTCSTWPDVKRPSRPGWGAKHSPLFQKTKKYWKKNRESSPLHFCICCFTSLRHPFSACYMPFYIIFQLQKSRNIEKKNRESSPLHFVSVVSRASDILFRHSICRSTSFFTLYSYFHTTSAASWFISEIFEIFGNFEKIIFFGRHMSHAICHPTSFFML